MNPNTIPGDLAPDLLTTWSGPARYIGGHEEDHRDGSILGPDTADMAGDYVFAGHPEGRYEKNAYVESRSVKAGELVLPLLRRECRLRVADWLAAGCRGAGYLRPPSPAWHLLDGQTGLTAKESAELLAWSAVSVVRGGGVIATLYDSWRMWGSAGCPAGVTRYERAPVVGSGHPLSYYAGKRPRWFTQGAPLTPDEVDAAAPAHSALRTPAGLVLPAVPEARP